MGNNSGRITKKKSNFSMISNTLALDPTISAKAKGIYLIICAELNKVNYTVYKSTIMECCKDGEASFESGWQELKKAGYLIQVKSKDETGRWVYDYELLDEPVKDEKDQDKNEEPDPENRGVVETSPDPENPGVENPGLENRGVYSILEKRNTGERNITSSSSSSINTPREDSTEQLIPLDDDDEKELNEITNVIFKVKEGKRLTSIPAKYGCDGDMIYPALKLALENRAEKLVPYITKIFKDWQEAGISHLYDLGLDKITTKDQIEKDLKLYQEQLEYDNEHAGDYVKDYPVYLSIFGPDKDYFTDKSDEFRAISKIYPPHYVLDVLRNMMINQHPVNEGIDLLMRRDRFEDDPKYRRYL